jgi:hypothetical protein
MILRLYLVADYIRKMVDAPSFDELDAAVTQLKEVSAGFSTIGSRADAINNVMAALRVFELWHADKSADVILMGMNKTPADNERGRTVAVGEPRD